MKMIVKAAIQIQRPVEEVFNGIVDPEKMCQYFISESTGPLETGKEVTWKWAEFPDYSCKVNQIHIVPHQSVSFVWDDDTRVNIRLEEQPDKSVVVRITEGEKEWDEAHLNWFGGNTEGWANFLAFLKAFLEHGINLRTGAFDFMRHTQPGNIR